MSSPQPDIRLIRMLLDRLERIPADSAWAHRASGIRGALMRKLERAELGSFTDPQALKSIIYASFQILTEVARARSHSRSGRPEK